MDECAARMFCQQFQNGADLNNGTSTVEAECEKCLQWFHSECVTFNRQDIGKQHLYCGCNIEDMWEICGSDYKFFFLGRHHNRHLTVSPKFGLNFQRTV